MNYNPNRLRIMNEDDFDEAVEWAETDASTFTENYITERGEVPDLDDFIETYPVYDHAILYPAIRKEMKRVTEIVMKEVTTA